MKRFLVFAFDVYYPSGGWHDFVSAHDTIEEAMQAVFATGKIDYVEVVDLEAQRVVYTKPRSLGEDVTFRTEVT